MTNIIKKSFGIIPIFKDKDDFKIVIVKNTKGGNWGFPKGTPEKDETPLQTAKRELFEETGIKDIEIKLEPIFIQKHSFELSGILYDKINSYYIGFTDSMTIGINLDEIDEMKWVSLVESKQFFTIDSLVETINALEKYLLTKK